MQAWKLVHSEVGSTEFKAWQAALKDLGDMELRNGLTRAQNFNGFFSLPSFRELCKTIDISAHGLPDAKAAYQEACRKPSPKAAQRWSHPAVYRAGVATGWHELHARPTDDIYPRFDYHYGELVKRVLAGEDITAPVPDALPEKINTPLTPEQRISRMAELRAAQGI